MTALVLAAAGLSLIAGVTYLICRPARRRTPHWPDSRLADRTYPLA